MRFIAQVSRLQMHKVVILVMVTLSSKLKRNYLQLGEHGQTNRWTDTTKGIISLRCYAIDNKSCDVTRHHNIYISYHHNYEQIMHSLYVFRGKALNGIQWEVAHPLPLNCGAPIASLDASICVRGVEFYKLETFCFIYVSSTYTTDTYSCIHRSDRSSVI